MGIFSMKTTDIDNVRNESKNLFDCINIKDTIASKEFGILILSHPFTNTSFVGGMKNGEQCILNIYDNDDDYIIWRNQIFKAIDKSDINRISYLINKPFLLTWFKFINYYLSEKDYAELLSYIWVTQENPNCDVNVSINEVIQFFKKANKKLLMNKEDYSIYNNLPKEFEVYRGVSPGRNLNGISYTTNRKKAEWFMHRFEKENKKGKLLKATIKKENVLAYFNTRDEEEIVVDITSINWKEIFI